MVSSILVYQYGVPAELAPASIIPVLFWLEPAGSSDDRGQRGHRVEVTVDSTGPSTVSCAGTVQCRTVQWTPVVIARQFIGRCGVLGITIKWWRERGRTFRLSLVIKRQNSYSSFRKRNFYKLNIF